MGFAKNEDIGMDLNRQIEIIEKQIECFDGFYQKMDYVKTFFGPDPEFTQEAIDMVVAKLCLREEENALDTDSNACDK